MTEKAQRELLEKTEQYHDLTYRIYKMLFHENADTLAIKCMMETDDLFPELTKKPKWDE